LPNFPITAMKRTMNWEVLGDWSVPHRRQAPRSPQSTGFRPKSDRAPFTLIGSRRIGKPDPPLKARESESIERTPVAALLARQAELRCAPEPLVVCRHSCRHRSPLAPSSLQVVAKGKTNSLSPMVNSHEVMLVD
jgi:hypothetical protein